MIIITYTNIFKKDTTCQKIIGGWEGGSPPPPPHLEPPLPTALENVWCVTGYHRNTFSCDYGMVTAISAKDLSGSNPLISTKQCLEK